MQSVLLNPIVNRFVNNNSRAASPAATVSLPATRDTVTLRFGAVRYAHPTPGLVRQQDGYYTGTITHRGNTYKIEPHTRLPGYADLSGADLRYANLSYAVFWDAKLSGADLLEANLSGADLRNARLGYANLTSAQNIPSSILDSSISRAFPAFYDIRQPLPTLEKGLTFAQLADRRIVPAHDANHAKAVYAAFEHLIFVKNKSPQAAFKALANQKDLGWTEQEKATLSQMAKASQPQGLWGRLLGGLLGRS